MGAALGLGQQEMEERGCFLSGRFPVLDKNPTKREWRMGEGGGAPPLPLARAKGSAKPATTLPKRKQWS